MDVPRAELIAPTIISGATRAVRLPHTDGMRLIAIVLALAGSGLASAEPADIAAVKDKLTLWSDGKKHFIAMVMTRDSDSPIFWSGDGQSFYRLRVTGGSSEGGDEDLKVLTRNFWEPRGSGMSPEAGFKWSAEEKQLNVECSTRAAPLHQLERDAAQKLIAQARFFTPRWNRYAYALARDAHGRYYYVDNVREPEGAKNFRLFAGPKGAMKQQKMLNVVSDSQGDIFSTANGELRLILSKQDSTWIANEKPKKLVWVPVDENHIMIYTDLGVYTGEPLGTPCDDL